MELPTGGIAFVGASNPAALVLEEEATRVTPQGVALKYKILNDSDAPLDLTLSFALPDLDFTDPDASYAIPGSDPLNFLGAVFKIDGKTAPFAMTQRATTMDGKDVTEALRRQKLALVPIGVFQNELATAAPDVRARLQKQGLINEAGTNAEGQPLYFPAWSVKTSGSKKVTIAPRASMQVAVSYKVSSGASRDTVLRRPLRDEKPLEPQVNFKKTTYCIDDGFLRGLDKISAANEANVAGLAESRIKIATRRGEDSGLVARKYSLTFDKLKTSRIVSFCSGHLKKISPTAFEMKAENYTPSGELNILLIDRIEKAKPVIIPAVPTDLPPPGNDPGGARL